MVVIVEVDGDDDEEGEGEDAEQIETEFPCAWALSMPRLFFAASIFFLSFVFQ